MSTTDQKAKRNKSAPAVPPTLRLEIVDNWHKNWPAVLECIRQSGQANLLLADVGGWLSARQSVLAAFQDDQVLGHLIFHVRTTQAPDAGVLLEDGRVVLEAHLDGLSVDARHKDSAIDLQLLDFAESHAKTLQCRGGLRH